MSVEGRIAAIDMGLWGLVGVERANSRVGVADGVLSCSNRVSSSSSDSLKRAFFVDAMMVG